MSLKSPIHVGPNNPRPDVSSWKSRRAANQRLALQRSFQSYIYNLEFTPTLYNRHTHDTLATHRHTYTQQQQQQDTHKLSSPRVYFSFFIIWIIIIIWVTLPFFFFTTSKSKKNWALHAVNALADDRRLPPVVELQSPFVLRGLCGHRKIKKTFRPPAHSTHLPLLYIPWAVCVHLFFSTQHKRKNRKKKKPWGGGGLGGLLPPPHQCPFSCEVTLPYWNTRRRRWNERTNGGGICGESLLEKLGKNSCCFFVDDFILGFCRL